MHTQRILTQAIPFCLLASVWPAHAQQVFMPSLAFPTNTPAQEPGPGLQTSSPAQSGPADSQSAWPLKWGAVDVRPHLYYRYVYGDGIQSNPGHPQSTGLNEISPGLQINLGPYWSLDYSPTVSIYTSRQFQNTVGHAALLTGHTSYDDWSLGLSQRFSSISVPLVETGTQTDQKLYTTDITASRPIFSKMAIELALNQDISSAENFNDYRQWSTSDWLDYQLSPRLNVGPGAGFGYVNVSSGPDMTFEQLQGQITCRAGQKTSIRLEGGAEERQFLNSGTGDRLIPIFRALVQYQLFEPTQLSVNAKRFVGNSLFQNQITERTSYTLDLNQRLLNKLYLGLSGGYEKVKYDATVPGYTVNRHDDYYTFSARLSRLVLKRGTVAIFYKHSENTSSENGFGFSSNQAGVEAEYHF